jgi:demethylmenaquinone methyltransferase/2-methoxy-6-polyprenyl-1,4-benzoquinol methylase
MSVELTTAPQSPPPKAVDKSDGRVRRMFGEIAGRYDFLNHVLSGGVDYWWRRTTVRTVPPGDAPVLDVCTGSGDLALAYWKAARGRVPVVGSDFTREMLVLAGEKARPLKTNRPAFVEADTQRLPFADDLFGVVSVAFGLRNVRDTGRGLAEMVRVCRPGGRVVVLEFSLPTNRLFRGAYLWYSRRVLPRIGQWLAPNRQSAYNYLPDSVAEFPHGQALADRMTAAGLVDVRFQPLTFGIATLYHGTKPDATAGSVALMSFDSQGR